MIKNKKIKIYILKTIFKDNKKTSKSILDSKLSYEISKKYLLSVSELNTILEQMQSENLIEFVAKQDKNGYNYIVKLKKQGDFMLRKEQNKILDFFAGIFVYLILIGLLLFLVFIIKNF